MEFFMGKKTAPGSSTRRQKSVTQSADKSGFAVSDAIVPVGVAGLAVAAIVGLVLTWKSAPPAVMKATDSQPVGAVGQSGDAEGGVRFRSRNWAELAASHEEGEVVSHRRLPEMEEREIDALEGLNGLTYQVDDYAPTPQFEPTKEIVSGRDFDPNDPWSVRQRELRKKIQENLPGVDSRSIVIQRVHANER